MESSKTAGFHGFTFNFAAVLENSAGRQPLNQIDRESIPVWSRNIGSFCFHICDVPTARAPFLLTHYIEAYIKEFIKISNYL